MEPLRLAIEDSRKVRFDYVREDRAHSARIVRPLALFYWGPAWTLAAWCELRDDFRSFRLDRILQLAVLDEAFTPETGRTLDDFYRHVCATD